MGPFARNAVLVVSVFSIFGLVACEQPQDQRTAPVEPIQMSARPTGGCDFGSMARDARGYFPGNGRGSVSNQVQDLIDVMKAECAAGDRAGYTDRWFDVAAIVESVLEAGTGGDPADGGAFLAASVSVVGPDGDTPIFDPCGGDANCRPWDGYPMSPDFTGVLASEHGAWAVVSSGSDAICSSFEHPCEGWNAGLLGDAWGVEPASTWPAALHGRTTLVFGQPLSGSSPTGETLLDTELPAYQWLIIPDVDAFGADGSPSSLEVGLCSTSTATADELLIQKNTTVLTEAALSWCSSQIPSVARVGGSAWERLLAFLSPTPAPLVATVASRGPGGSAGSFTDFYAVDLPRASVIALSSQPADGFVGQPILGRDGQPLVVRTLTSSMQSPIENALVTMQVIGNGGLIPSGNDVSATGLTCNGFVCTGRTQADQDPTPGSLALPLVFTKTGSYSLCLSAGLPPLSFSSQVCTEKFNVRP